MSTLMLLVGSNPLPNYLTACALQPKTLFLVYTNETKDAKDRLRAEFCASLVGTSLTDVFVQDATSATEVERAVGLVHQKTSGVHLNYTGGTKVMAAHARIAFAHKGGKSANASYLDEGCANRLPRLRFDDGTEQWLTSYPNLPLSLDTLLELHGIKRIAHTAYNPAPTEADVREIACKVLGGNLELAAELYEEKTRLSSMKLNEALAAPFRATTYGLVLSVPEFPAEVPLNAQRNGDAKKSWLKQWRDFIGGGWLEEWTALQIRSLGLTPDAEIEVSVDGKRGEKKAQLEVDVAVLRRHRAHLISCTIDRQKPLCKSKLFEIAVRSRHLGGDLARAALVCLADGTTTAALQADIEDLWGAANTTRVFGLEDVECWSDCEGKTSNRESLKTWLES